MQLIISCSLILLAIIATLTNTFLRKPKQPVINENIGNDKKEIKEYPPVTIVITVHNEAENLERNLPLFLSQDYSGNSQIIVVVEKGDSQSEDILKKHSDSSNLYFTYIPQSSRYMSRKKLAITLGVKAAKNEWIILTEPNVAPSSNRWLQHFARYISDDYSIIMGCTVYDDEASAYKRYEHTRTAIYSMRNASHSTAFRTNMPLVAFSKSQFLDRHGFRGNHMFLRGEYDFIVNKYGKITNIAIDEEAWCTEAAPSKKQWSNKHIFYQETRRHLNGKFRYRCFFCIEQILLHFSFIGSIAAIVFASIFNNWVLLGCSISAVLLLLSVRTAIANKSLASYRQNIKLILLPFFELSLVWRNLWWKIRYIKANKTDFISHKLNNS